MSMMKLTGNIKFVTFVNLTTMQRKNPETSLSAWKQAQPMISPHHQKILSALQVLGSDTAEGIAKYLGMEHSQINRRVSEMERLQMIYKPGITKPTKSGRMAYVWCIAGNNLPKTYNEVKYKAGEKTAAEYAGDLIKTTQLSLL